MAEIPPPSSSNNSSEQMENEAKESITERLSLLDDLYFPRKVQPSAAADPSRRKSLLLDLLSTDAAVFLERYGSKLSLDELDQFDTLKNDYEVNWHLSHLRSAINPTEQEKKSQSARIKNRRLAYMDKLTKEGHYFSEDSMREREPYLHHELLGKYQDPSGRRMARPGERWSETLMRRCEEAFLVEKIRGEQQRLGVDEGDWVGNGTEEGGGEEERESEEDEESGDEGNGRLVEEMVDDDDEEEEKEVAEFGTFDDGSSQANSQATHPREDRRQDTTVAGRPAGPGVLSDEEANERMGQLTYIMQQKFLAGEDHQYMDYKRIDEDVTLDDHWIKEANQDAEERYFDDI